MLVRVLFAGFLGFPFFAPPANLSVGLPIPNGIPVVPRICQININGRNAAAVKVAEWMLAVRLDKSPEDGQTTVTSHGIHLL